MRPRLPRARREREPDAAPRAAAEGSGSPECGVVTCDPDGRIVAVNRHARLLLGDAERAATGADGPLGRALRGEEHVSGVHLEVAAGAGTVVLEASVERVTGADGAVLGAVMVLTDVTGRAAAARREFESAVVGRLAEAVVVIRARDGCILYANATTERVFGHGAEKLVGRHASCLSVTSDEPPGRRASQIAAAVAAGQVWTGDVEGRRADGTRIWTSLRVSGLDHAVHGALWICVHAEAAPRLAAEEAAREAETRFRAVFEIVPVAMVLMGRDLRILDANRAAATLTGVPREELAGRSLAELMDPADAGRDAGLAARLFAGDIDVHRSEQRIVTPHGRRVPVAVTTTVVSDGGRAAYALAMLETFTAPTGRGARWARAAPC